MKNYKVFAINPGSTSTKIAMFEGEKEIFSRNISHDAEKLKEFKEISDQLPYRKEMIMKELEKNYNPSAIEEKLYQKWLDNKYFRKRRRPGKCGRRRFHYW